MYLWNPEGLEAATGSPQSGLVIFYIIWGRPKAGKIKISLQSRPNA
jgi:hypothetical protein